MDNHIGIRNNIEISRSITNTALKAIELASNPTHLLDVQPVMVMAVMFFVASPDKKLSEATVMASKVLDEVLTGALDLVNPASFGDVKLVFYQVMSSFKHLLSTTESNIKESNNEIIKKVKEIFNEQSKGGEDE